MSRKGYLPPTNMYIEEFLIAKPRYLYVEIDDLDLMYEMDYTEVKRLIKWHNDMLETNYQTINEFNDDEDYRKIKIQLK
jgi:hypothetical protein